MREVIGVRAEHAEAVVAVAERQRHDPGDLGALGDVLIAFPGDVVGGVADAKDGIEQQIEAAAAGADDQIGAGNRVGEALPRAGADLFDAKQQHDADGDGEHGQQRRHPAVEQRLQRQRGRSSSACTSRRNRDVVEPHDTVEVRCQPFVVTDHDDARAGRRALREQELQKRTLGVAVERRGRLVRDDDLRRADQCAGGGNALLLTDAQARGRHGRR